MGKYILAGVGNATLFSTNGDIIARSKTLTESGLTVDLSNEDVRGGGANKLLGRYFHSSGFNVTLTDALFSMEYIALNVGGEISVGGENLVTDPTFTVTTANTITVQGTPKAWNNMSSVVGWYSVVGEDDWHTITFNGQTATVAGLAVGTKVCVKYNVEDNAMRQFVVPADMIPDICYLELELPLFASSVDGSYTASSKVGTMKLDVPKFVLSGSQDLSLSATGAATTSLSGSALVCYDSVSGCDDDGYYAIMKEIITGRTYLDGLQTIAIDGGNFSIVKSTSKAISVIGIYEGGVTGTIPTSKITFTVTGSVGTFSGNTFTASSSAGSGTIVATITEKTAIAASASVTVTAS